MLSYNSKISYFNGDFKRNDEIYTRIDDRGMQFADGVYEVILFHDGKLVDAEAHLDRLFRSLNEIEIDNIKLSKQDFIEQILELFKRNSLNFGYVYVQITRGFGERFQGYIESNPQIFMSVSVTKSNPKDEIKGSGAILVDDIRWKRRDIKSTSLLGNIMVKNKANKAGVAEVILKENGYITEGSFSNLFAVIGGVLVTRPCDGAILCGITRSRILEIAKKNGIKYEERKISDVEIFLSDEVFVTSSTLLIRPIVVVDGVKIGNGEVGNVSKKLREFYNLFLEREI